MTASEIHDQQEILCSVRPEPTDPCFFEPAKVHALLEISAQLRFLIAIVRELNETMKGMHDMLKGK